MTKRALSVTLDPDNLVWLKGQVRLRGVRSVSELIDRMVTEARTNANAVAPGRSVRGTIEIVDLDGADEDLRQEFEHSLARGSGTSKGR